jgi:hypothetical protein
MWWKVLGAVLGVALGALLISQYPEIRRYIRIRTM